MKIVHLISKDRLIKSLFMLLVTVAFCHLSFAAATPEQIAASLARNALTNTLTVQIITDLTTEIGPRLDGSEAEKRAADWAKERFEKLGYDKVWIESFPLLHGWERGVEKAEVTSPSPQPLLVTALGSSVATPPEGLEAEVVVFKTYDALLSAANGSLAGKIAVVTQPMERGREGFGYGKASKIRTAGASEAAKRGAIAYLLRSLATGNDRFPHTGIQHYQDGVTKIPAAALAVPDAEQLERLAAKGPVRIKLVLTPRDLGEVTSQNVIAEITGREKPGEIVLLGAHLDSWDLGTGALDDGAGVGVVMAAAKLIRDLPQPPKRTIRVVLYGSEETGLLGGYAYAQAHTNELSHYVVVAEPDHGQGPVHHLQTGVVNTDEPTLKHIVKAMAPLGIKIGNNKSHGSSDVEPLFDAGVPAMTLEMDGTDYFDYHHTANDTLDKISSKRINQTAAAYAVFTYLAAELGGDYRKPAK